MVMSRSDFTIKMVLYLCDLYGTATIVPEAYNWGPVSPLLGCYNICSYSIHVQPWMVTHPSANRGPSCSNSVFLRDPRCFKLGLAVTIVIEFVWSLIRSVEVTVVLLFMQSALLWLQSLLYLCDRIWYGNHFDSNFVISCAAVAGGLFGRPWNFHMWPFFSD